MNGGEHIPVLLEETLEYLNIHRKGIYIDCTLGLGGHASEILQRNPNASLIGFDLDERSLLKAKENLSPFAQRVTLYHSDFRYLPDLNLNFSKVRGILIDLGMSSFQLNSPERGFSHTLEGPLDMRMDLRNKTTAFKILHKYSEPKLAQIFRDFGELKPAKKLAKVIASRRRIKEIETTTELRQLVEDIFSWRPQKGKIHPAAKVFQALRIEVNQELKDLDAFLERVAYRVPPQTRIVVISFHSLEDRIIKHTFLSLSMSPNNHNILRILTKKPVTPGPEEIDRNPRARSAKMRAAERIPNGTKKV
ncbi:MAG: 16S rRNA (cytosine(1402)-N(4))-methyltransferase RsmH [Candidatus Aminicenantales bacterium]